MASFGIQGLCAEAAPPGISSFLAAFSLYSLHPQLPYLGSGSSSRLERQMVACV